MESGKQDRPATPAQPTMKDVFSVLSLMDTDAWALLQIYALQSVGMKLLPVMKNVKNELDGMYQEVRALNAQRAVLLSANFKLGTNAAATHQCAKYVEMQYWKEIKNANIIGYGQLHQIPLFAPNAALPSVPFLQATPVESVRQSAKAAGMELWKALNSVTMGTM